MELPFMILQKPDQQGYYHKRFRGRKKLKKRLCKSLICGIILLKLSTDKIPQK